MAFYAMQDLFIYKLIHKTCFHSVNKNLPKLAHYESETIWTRAAKSQMMRANPHTVFQQL